MPLKWRRKNSLYVLMEIQARYSGSYVQVLAGSTVGGFQEEYKVRRLSKKELGVREAAHVVTPICNLSVWDMEAGVSEIQCHPQPHIEASLDYMKLCFKNR